MKKILFLVMLVCVVDSFLVLAADENSTQDSGCS